MARVPPQFCLFRSAPMHGTALAFSPQSAAILQDTELAAAPVAILAGAVPPVHCVRPPESLAPSHKRQTSSQ